MLGLRFSRLVHAAIASGALLLAACPDGGKDTGGDTDPTTSTGGPDPTHGSATLSPTTVGTTLNPTTLDPTTATTATTIDPTTATTGDPTTGVDTTGGPDDGPALIGVALIDPSILQLTFSEAVAPIADVNPKRFRLSVALGYAGYYGPPSTRVYSPEYFNPECIPVPSPCYYDPNYYYCYQPYYCYYQPSAPMFPDALAQADPYTVLLHLSAPVRPILCQFVEGSGGSAVLHLHYADGGLAQIADFDGNPMLPLAEEFVKSGEGFIEYQDIKPFSNFDPFLPIPCPF